MSRRNREDRPISKISGYIVSDIQEIANLQSGAGIRFLNWLLIEEAGIHKTPFRTSSEKDFLMGMQNLGYKVLDHLKKALEHDAGKYMKIQDACIYNTLIDEEERE